MKISIIIPTHNRADSLRQAIDSIVRLRDEADFEFVIVDNNSTDGTKQVVASYAPLARYVFEGATSFTRARKAGADAARGDVLLYLDDDVIVRAGSLRGIVELFSRHADCGVIAGHIDPKYEAEPPAWTLECQRQFNGWSLFNRDTYRWLRKDLQQVPSAAGPMMAIRRGAYDAVGGFPPDTIGVETNRGPKSFNKLYIGPGDYGLCLRIRDAGFKVYYSTGIAVFHVIPPVRFSVSFWRSRVIGEGYHHAITLRGFFGAGPARLALHRLRYQLEFFRYERRLLRRLRALEAPAGGMLPEELMVRYYKAFLDMDYVLRRHPRLWRFLWQIADEGVTDANYDQVMAALPAEYKELVGNEVVYDPTPVASAADYERLVRGKGYYQRNISPVFRNETSKALVLSLEERLALTDNVKSLRRLIRGT